MILDMDNSFLFDLLDVVRSVPLITSSYWFSTC